MRALFLILFTFCFSGVYATENWYSNLKLNPENLKNHSRRAVVFSIDRNKVKQLYRKSPSAFTLQIPVPEGEKTIVFTATDIHAAGFEVLDASGRNIKAELDMPLHFKGQKNRRGKEMAALSIFSDGNFVLVYSDASGNINLASLPENLRKHPDEYVAFRDADLLHSNPFRCGIDHDGPVPENAAQSNPSGNQIQNDSTCRLTEIYWECDYDMYQRGGGFQGALNRFEAMFNGTAILYEIETINIGVKALKIWDTPDPYTYTSSFSALDDFLSAGNAADWPGQLAHLLSTRPLNLGGVAYLNAICTDYRYGFSNIDFFFNNLPAYSWTLSTIAHELGHNFSSNHTHNCGWEVEPGIFQQIDSCWNAEGGCQPSIRGRVGTIMSYCHLTGSVNLSLGFGPLPGDRIREAYANMPCVSGSIVIPNFTPINNGPFCIGDSIRLNAETLPGFSYIWAGPNGFSSNEQSPLLPDLGLNAEGEYSLQVKRLACTSREKSTNLVFNCLQVGKLPTSVCAGSEISIPLSSTGSFNPNNFFIAQLSSSTGSFSNPLNLDTFQSNLLQPVRLVLPAGLPMGNLYQIRFLSTSPAYTGKPPLKSLAINPVGVSPGAVNGERCGPGSVSLSATGGTSILWTSSEAETVPIFMGRKFITPVISESTNYFIQSGGTTRAEAGLKTVAGNLNSTTQEDGIAFESHATFRLDSVRLFHEISSNPICEIVLKKDGNDMYSRVVTNLAGSTQTKVPLFWRVNPGQGYQLICRNIGAALKRSTVSFPLKVTNLISMENSISASGDYPYLFSWVIAKYTGCPSRKVPVQARILAGDPPPLAELSVVADSISSGVQAGQIEWIVNGQLIQNYNYPKIQGLVNSSYQVRYKLDSCWSDWTAPFTYTAPTRVNGLVNDGIVFFPNPASGKLFWNSIGEIQYLSLLSAEGKRVFEGKMSGKTHLDLSRFPEGFYLLQWRTGTASGTEHLMLQR